MQGRIIIRPYVISGVIAKKQGRPMGRPYAVPIPKRNRTNLIFVLSGLAALHRDGDVGHGRFPGAVPVGLGNTVAPRGSNACLRVLGDGSLPRLRALIVMSAHTSGRSSKGTSKAAAIASVVRSSGVGPNPPVVISTDERSAASCTKPNTRSRLSPSTDWR